MLIRFGAAFAAIALGFAGTPAFSQTGADLQACIASPDIAVRDPCVRTGLTSGDANIRAAALAAAFRYRKNLVVSFEIPEQVRAWQKRVDEGESWSKASSDVRRMRRFVDETGQVVSLMISSFDAQANTFKVTAMDTRFDDKKPNAGAGYVSGDTVQISTEYNSSLGMHATCSIELTLNAGVEMRGFIGCTGTGAFPRTSARMRIM